MSMQEMSSKMDGASRFVDNLVTNVSLRTAFSAELEAERMGRLRPNITEVRRRWETNEGYRGLVQQVKSLCDQDEVSSRVRSCLDRLFEGYRDYADMDLGRPWLPQTAEERFEAIELYCSEDGYQYITKMIQTVFRTAEPSADELIRATAFVEWITIDLYNLRLSQIGDPRFENFQGIVYRWCTLRPEDLEEYRAILRLSDHARRNFSIPLGLVSTAADGDATRHFADLPTGHEYVEGKDKRIRVRQTVHIHGMDPALLASFKQQYPDSVVTSICAMPVARMSPFGEQEILLRGPFFHLITIKECEDDRGRYVESVTVAMNSNRDHGSEHSSNDDEKARQRIAFLNAVNASKWEVCARIAEGTDAEAYRELQTRTLTKLADEFGMAVSVDGRLSEARSQEVATWLGGVQAGSYPSHYAQRRITWQTALVSGDWVAAEKVMADEYAWRRSEWYNVGQLVGDDNQAATENSFTVLHEMVRHAPEDGLETTPGNENDDAWRRLIDAALEDGLVWSESLLLGLTKYNRTMGLTPVPESLGSLDENDTMTAAELALQRGLLTLAERLKPRFCRELEATLTGDLQTQLHNFIQETVAPFVSTQTPLLRSPVLTLE